MHLGLERAFLELHLHRRLVSLRLKGLVQIILCEEVLCRNTCGTSHGKLLNGFNALWASTSCHVILDPLSICSHPKDPRTLPPESDLDGKLPIP